MPRLSSLVLAFFIGAFFGKVTQAQTIQPTYTRPSKGAALTILNAAAPNATTTYTPSAIFDWTAFAGVIVTVNAPTPTPPATSCGFGVRVKALGGTSTNRSEFFLLNVANNDYRANSSQAWYIRVLPGYLTFALESYQASASAACSGNFKVTITPLPIDYAGQLISTGVLSAWGSGDSEIGYAQITLNSTYNYTRIQNLGSSVARCIPVGANSSLPPAPPDPSPLPPVKWPIQLAPELLGGGGGGVIEITNWVGVIECIGDVGVFQH